MLIEFSVSNFRSFRERQTLSMLAAPRLLKRDNVFQPEVDGERFHGLLKVAVIYGPNASGKSNLVKALSVVQTIARQAPRPDPIPLPLPPFRFDPALSEAPSRFELHFINQKQRYRFDLVATRGRIFEERLAIFVRGEEEVLYERRFEEGGDRYTLGPTLEGGTDLHEAWKKLTGPQ